MEYFKPSYYPKKVVIVPSDNITHQNTGWSIRLGEEVYIFSHSTNPANFDHECMHPFINPIVEKLSLTEADKSKVVTLASERLKQDYGTSWFCLLNEELIRTYNDAIIGGRVPVNLNSFRQEIRRLTEEDFQKLAQEGKDSELLQKLGIKSKEELLAQADLVYQRHIRNKLRERIYKFYKEYEASGRNGFEQFLCHNIRIITTD